MPTLHLHAVFQESFDRDTGQLDHVKIGISTLSCFDCLLDFYAIGETTTQAVYLRSLPTSTEVGRLLLAGLEDPQASSRAFGDALQTFWGASGAATFRSEADLQLRASDKCFSQLKNAISAFRQHFADLVAAQDACPPAHTVRQFFRRLQTLQAALAVAALELEAPPSKRHELYVLVIAERLRESQLLAAAITAGIQLDDADLPKYLKPTHSRQQTTRI